MDGQQLSSSTLSLDAAPGGLENPTQVASDHLVQRPQGGFDVPGTLGLSGIAASIRGSRKG